MSDHTHAWQPTEGRMAQYHCACGATAYRDRRGKLVEHREPLRRTVRWTAVGDVHCRPGRRIPAVPGSDKQFERSKK